MFPQQSTFLVALNLCLLSATITASPTPPLGHRLTFNLNEQSAENLTYPPEGIEYSIPSSDYKLRFYTVLRPERPQALSLSAIEVASEHGANIFDTIRERLTPGTLVDFHKSGAVGGKVDYEGISIHLSKPVFAAPTYEDAYWILKGMAGAARERVCRDTARIVAFRSKTDTKGDAMDGVVSFVDLGRYDESNVQVA